MADDPFALFDAWFEEARDSELNEPEAMALATASPDGRPSVRMVLLKGYGPEGFTFFTHAESRKGSELAANPVAALLFHWKSLRRQIRIEGPISEVSSDVADAYFATRSRDARLGAHASLQSRPLESRAKFEAQYEEAKDRFEGRDVPRPERWTGFRVEPETMEFWADRPHRLHERRLFVRKESGWSEGLLYP
jgi:pyridoxamine 5'-phosphate oxidase